MREELESYFPTEHWEKSDVLLLAQYLDPQQTHRTPYDAASCGAIYECARYYVSAASLAPREPSEEEEEDAAMQDDEDIDPAVLKYRAQQAAASKQAAVQAAAQAAPGKAKKKGAAGGAGAAAAAAAPAIVLISEEGVQPAVHQSRFDAEWEYFDTHVRGKNLADPVLKDKMQASDPLVWWQGLSKSLPVLSLVACSILAIPATSADTERLFSLGGRIVSKMRSNLTPENAQQLILSNVWLLQKREVREVLGTAASEDDPLGDDMADGDGYDVDLKVLATLVSAVDGIYELKAAAALEDSGDEAEPAAEDEEDDDEDVQPPPAKKPRKA